MMRSSVANNPRQALKIQSHYHKFAHILLVSFLVYALRDDVLDLSLLELELEIRARHPRILITYYNKHLYHFRLGHWETPGAGGIDESDADIESLESSYPQLVLKQKRNVSASKLANPVRASKTASAKKDGQTKEDSPNDENLPFASLSFLKAVKKSLMYNLSLQGEMVIFGNCVVGRILGTNYQYRVTQIDPILLANGDIIASLTQRNSLILFHSSILNLETSFNDFLLSFVVYVIPSGLRCHLYDTSNILASFTKTPPKGSEKVIRLLELSTGIKLSPEDNQLWVKLIPNLQHLNNQTSKISRFIHSVDNKKYILWPWKLCLLQFGSAEVAEPEEFPVPSIDPMSLISDFLQFSLSNNEERKQKEDSHPEQQSIGHMNTTTPKSFLNDFDIASVGKTSETQKNYPEQSIQESTHEHSTSKYDIPSIEMYPTFPDMMAEGALVDGQKNHEHSLSNNESEKDKKNDEIEDVDMDEEDDLFGESLDLEKESENVSELQPNLEHDATSALDLEENNDKKSPTIDIDDSFQIEHDSQTEKEFNTPGLDMKFDFKTATSLSPEHSTIIDIPRDQMISSMQESQSPSSYEDPGAPPPLAPTPIIPQNPNNPLAGFDTPKNPFKLQRRTKPFTSFSKSRTSLRDDSLDNNMKYMFSPIIFNPKIKNKLDTKYGKGGKFYVERETGSDSENPKLHQDRLSSITNIEDFNNSLKNNNSRLDQQSISDVSDKIPPATSNMEDIRYLSIDTGTGITKEQNLEVQETDLTLIKAEKDFDNTLFENAYWLSDQDHGNSLSESGRGKNVAQMEEFEEEEEDDEEEESDVDEEFPDSRESPLKLNLSLPHNSQSSLPLGPSSSDHNKAQELTPHQRAFSVPFSFSKFPSKKAPLEETESPFESNLGQSFGSISFSPITSTGNKRLDTEELGDQSVMQIDDANGPQISASNQASPGTLISENNNDESESSNCLPLIHRSINVFSIPSKFLIREQNDWDPASSTSGFAIDVDEEEDDDFQNKDRGLSVNGSNIEGYLSNLTPNLTFDAGSFSISSLLQLKLPDTFKEEVVEEVTDGLVSAQSLKVISSVFPYTYPIDLAELVSEDQKSSSNSPSESAEEQKSQMSFLDEIVDGSLLDPVSSKKGPNDVYWDTLIPNKNGNGENFQLYCDIFDEQNNCNVSSTIEDNSIFLLNNVKSKVQKNDNEIINLDFIGTQFWKYLDFCPINGPKQFQVLLLTENDTLVNNGRIYDSSNPSFIELLKHNYRNNHLGNMKRLHLPAPETRQDLDGISNGLIVLDKQPGNQAYLDYYKKLNKRLKDLAELIKLDLINKSNRFEFDRPLLLLFVSNDTSIYSVSQISKICRNFQLFLQNHQVSLVNVFSHIIPGAYLSRQVGNSCRLKILSDLKLSKLSMMLYNKCPSEVSHSSKLVSARLSPQHNFMTKSLYTQLVQEPPSSLHFKVLNKINREGSSSAFYDDLFLHVAYERSVDKEWMSAAWSDPSGAVTHGKSWYCQGRSLEHRAIENRDLGSIINDIWTISSILFAKLNEDPLQQTFGSGKKKYLVLTRISSIIPDDELIHWKRLTTKDKDISLVVLSTNRLPKILFQAKAGDKNEELNARPDANGFKNGKGQPSDKTDKANAEFIKSFDGANASPTSALNFTSPLNQGNGSQSPSQFLNNLASFLSPMDVSTTTSTSFYEQESVVKPPFYDILAVLPKVALPSFNSPTRLGMLIGYLLKELPEEQDSDTQKYMVFEVTLLSCSAYWNLRSLMKILLNHYKKMIVLNEVVGTCDREGANCNDKKEANLRSLRSFVPWHISAVGKTLEYLTHVHVDGIDP